jgi:hypothetical protein
VCVCDCYDVGCCYCRKVYRSTGDCTKGRSQTQHGSYRRREFEEEERCVDQRTQRRSGIVREGCALLQRACDRSIRRVSPSTSMSFIGNTCDTDHHHYHTTTIPLPHHCHRISLPTKVGFRFLESGDKVRVSKRTGTVIPRPLILSMRSTRKGTCFISLSLSLSLTTNIACCRAC